MTYSGTVISNISRHGDVGEPGYTISGEDLPESTKSGRHDYWHGATQGTLRDVFPSAVITESFLAALTKPELESIRSRIRGVVDNSYCGSERVCGYFGCGTRYYLKSEIRPLPEPDPCEGVTCDPKCVGVDRYATACKDGVCVRGALMEANSTKCGYVAPVCTEGAKRGKMTCWNGTVIHGEVCRGNKWVTSGETCPPKPECAEGDKKPGHICSGGKWVPYTPEPGAGRLYVKFAIPWLDMLPGIPYEPWMIIPPGFKVVEET